MIVEHREMHRLAEQMRRNWVDQGVPVNPGLSVSEIDTFESRHGILLPQDFKIYLGVVNGMATVDMDKDWFTFKALQGMSIWDSKLTFADSVLESAIFCLALDPTGAPFSPVLRWSVKETRIAESFGSFVQIYLSEPDSLGQFGG